MKAFFLFNEPDFLLRELVLKKTQKNRLLNCSVVIIGYLMQLETNLAWNVLGPISE